MSDQKRHHFLTSEDLRKFTESTEFWLWMLDQQELKLRRRLLEEDVTREQHGWWLFNDHEREEFGWRESILRLHRMTERRLKRTSPLMQQTKAYSRLEHLKEEIRVRMRRHLRMMDRMMEEEGL